MTLKYRVKKTKRVNRVNIVQSTCKPENAMQALTRITSESWTLMLGEKFYPFTTKAKLWSQPERVMYTCRGKCEEEKNYVYNRTWQTHKDKPWLTKEERTLKEKPHYNHNKLSDGNRLCIQPPPNQESCFINIVNNIKQPYEETQSHSTKKSSEIKS